MDTFFWGLTSLPDDHALVSENILDFVINQWNTLHWNHKNVCMLRNIKPLWLPPKRYPAVDQARTLGVHGYLLQYTTSYDCLSKTEDGETEWETDNIEENCSVVINL
jgi:hypothetical protein